MSIFAKKSEGEQGSRGDRSPGTSGLGRGYGIAEAIQLLRSLPTDQDSDLIVRVVRTTLESLGVRLSDIVDDATHKQQLTEERISAVRDQVVDLEKQLAELRGEIAGLEGDLKETTEVKERLQMADKGSTGARSGASRGEGPPTLSYGQHMPPPLPGAAR
jgi:DNA-binding transcriptional MerR regulator